MLEYFTARYRSWPRHTVQRYVNHKIARIAERPGSRSLEGFDFLHLLVALDLSINPERRAMASGASDRNARYTLLASVLENTTGDIFPSVGRGVWTEKD